MTKRKHTAGNSGPPQTPDTTPAPRRPSSTSGDTHKLLTNELHQKVTTLTETNRQLKRKIFDLYTIFEISRNFNSVLNYQQLLDTFILTSLAQVGSSKAAIFLRRDRTSNLLHLAKQRGAGPFPDKDCCFKIDSDLGKHLAGLNRPVRTGDLSKDIADEDETRIVRIFHPGLIVPLIYQSGLRGVFCITDKMAGREFAVDDVEFLSILGNQISVAIENARLYESETAAAQQLRSAQEQLVQAERLAALGEMSAKVAHEVNNPLGIVKNYLLLALRTVSGNKDTGNYLKIAGEEIDRIAAIVRELLDFHRPQPPKLIPLPVTQVLDDVLRLMDRKLENAGIELNRDYPNHCPLVKASPENLKQVFLNLIINGVDAMQPDGGTLSVACHSEDGHVVLSFADTGPGIDPSHIPRIFEPFFTTKQPGKGTGLGLSVCYGIIKRHGGSITYRNTNNGGLFEIRLPLAEQQP
jgi:signal transduction histidine kinase